MLRSKSNTHIRSPRLSQKLEPLPDPLRFLSEKDLHNVFKDFVSEAKSPLVLQHEPRLTAIYYKLPKIINKKSTLPAKKLSNDVKDSIEPAPLSRSPINTRVHEDQNNFNARNKLDFTFGLD